MFKQGLFSLTLSALAVASLTAFPAVAKLTLSGEVSQGGLIVGQATPGAVVKLNDKMLKVSKQGQFAFGFSRDDNTSYQLLVTNPDGTTEQKTLTPKGREYKIQRINGIKKSIMKPNPKAVARAKKDSAQVKAARAKDSNLTAFADGFAAPIKGIVTGVYGSQRFYNGVPKTPHYGLDYAGKKGDPVKAPADGVITLNVPDMFYSGGTMIIDHGHGISSTFLHLSDSYVKVGDKVKQGDVVAAVGSTGRSTGPHLDWRVNWFNVRLDPALALKANINQQ
ncbi:M23 family peptidase [Thalassotalea euphylliae]|uniref:M23 family peptidase n=1 Tax=Thalassotalea euphylliae TaxID=1655234 RepID=A0A3E0TRB9_9GAMM|nr:M23 family metallopeptidase [Thalassotalea euphylliae]REL26900.1 M23 family peptidase [Thalassotalea euphylliae]